MLAKLVLNNFGYTNYLTSMLTVLVTLHSHVLTVMVILHLH